MKPYRTVLIILYTAALTSFWWMACLWPDMGDGLIWFPAIAFTVAAILCLIIACGEESGQ